MATFYFRSDSATVNGLAAKRLLTTNTGAEAYLEIYQSLDFQPVYGHSQICIRSEGGTETVLGAFGSAAYNVPDSTGQVSPTWVCPATPLAANSSIVVRQALGWSPGAVDVSEAFSTAALSDSLGASTWRWTLYTDIWLGSDMGTQCRLYFGSSGRPSRIDGVVLVPAGLPYGSYTPSDDGYIKYATTDWAAAKAATVGTAMSPTASSLYAMNRGDTASYGLYRSFLDFNIADFLEEIGEAYLSLVRTGSAYIPHDLCLFAGTQTWPLSTAQFQAFTGVELADRVPSPSTQYGIARFVLNAAGIAYLNACGPIAKFCLRGAADVDNTGWDATNNLETFGSSEIITAAYRPLLELGGVQEAPTVPYAVLARQSRHLLNLIGA